MPPRDWRLRVEDMVACLDQIAQYVEGMDFHAFQGDRKTQDAVLLNIAVLGEAATRTVEEVQLAHPEVPWAEMRDIRNVVIHEYFGTSLPIVWKTITEDLPPLRTRLRSLLNSP